LYQVNAQESFQSCLQKHIDITDSLKIEAEDLPKYKDAYNYVLSDSVNQRKSIFVSDVIVDMDRVYFKDYVKNDSALTYIINSLTKHYWFDNFSSFEIKELFKEQNKNAESILFFSLIEQNTLRVDLFFNRKNKKEFRYNWLSNYDVEEVYAYLFFFDEMGKIKHVYRTKIIYGI
jgi:hypothetical protein